jgi:hypothetical protein
MGIKKGLLAISISIAAVSPAWAVNKCTGADGKVVFQDAPCAGKGETIIVRPASGNAKTNTDASTSAGPVRQGSAEQAPQKMSEVQRINAQVAASQQERRKQEMEVRLVPDAEGAVSRQRATCDREMRALQTKKSYANNNLAGATWEGAISGEMTALATVCDTRNRELRDNAAALRAECQQIGGCKR